MTDLFGKFAPIIAAMTLPELQAEIRNPSKLLLGSASHRGKRIDTVYAPFDYINPKARVVLIGLTPGRQQMANALEEAHRRLRAGQSTEFASRCAKTFASFSGPMRTNLVEMLNDVGVARLLGIPSTNSLWNGSAEFVHFTSALRYPVFVDTANYSGSPDMFTVPLLVSQLRDHLRTEMTSLPGAVFVPLGPKVSTAVETIAKEAGIDLNRVLAGLPHPSGANAERIAYFLGKKHRENLSRKTNAEALDAARQNILAKIRNLGS